MTSLAEYRESRELMVNLTLRELRGKYKRSALGWAWSMLNPLANMILFTLVFRYFLKVKAPAGHDGLDVFALFLMCGLLPWNYLNAGVNGSIGMLVGNANLIKKTYFPRELLVTANVGSNLVSLLIEMSLLMLGLIIFGNAELLLYLPVTLVLLVLLTVFVTGLGLLFSVVNVYFRDVEYLMAIVFQVWFYLTPIVYPFNLVPHDAQLGGVTIPVHTILSLNPMTQFVGAFRDTLYNIQMPAGGTFVYLVLMSAVSIVLGLAVFNRLEGRLAEEL